MILYNSISFNGCPYDAIIFIQDDKLKVKYLLSDTKMSYGINWNDSLVVNGKSIIARNIFSSIKSKPNNIYNYCRYNMVDLSLDSDFNMMDLDYYVVKKATQLDLDFYRSLEFKRVCKPERGILVYTAHAVCPTFIAEITGKYISLCEFFLCNNNLRRVVFKCSNSLVLVSAVNIELFEAVKAKYRFLRSTGRL